MAALLSWVSFFPLQSTLISEVESTVGIRHAYRTINGADCIFLYVAKGIYNIQRTKGISEMTPDSICNREVAFMESQEAL